jgi:hypothetical protein
MKELVFKKQNGPGEVYRGAHMDVIVMLQGRFSSASQNLVSTKIALVFL